MGDNDHTFKAVRGRQAGGAFYIAMCSMKAAVKMFTFDDADMAPEHRAQRVLRKARIPKIRDYILQNPEDYIFSSITVSVDGKIKFEPTGDVEDLGTISVSQDASILINDGQHRMHAIKEAIKENPALGRDDISVVFFEDQKLKKSQQMFADLNKHAVKPTKSLGILYDHRNDFSSFIVDMIGRVGVFGKRIEMEKTSISNRTVKFFTLSGLALATKNLLGKDRYLKDDEKELAVLFWNTVAKNIPEWRLIMDNKTTPSELRKDYVHANANTLEAIATAGREIIRKHPHAWRQKLAGLQGIDWTKKNPEWQGNIMIGKKMTKTKAGMDDAAKIILGHCGGK